MRFSATGAAVLAAATIALGAIVSALSGRHAASAFDRRPDQNIDELLRVSPTPEGRALAVKLWTMFGEPEKAQRVKIP